MLSTINRCPKLLRRQAPEPLCLSRTFDACTSQFHTEAHKNRLSVSMSDEIGRWRMKVAAKLLLVFLGTSITMAQPQTINFDNLKGGAPPPGWTATKTGSGQEKWTIERDDTAPSKPNVLRQSGQATYPVCIKEDTDLKDGFVEVKFKPISGKEDQAGGLIWRAKDANNYYVARANALEDNVTIYLSNDARPTEK